MDEMWLILFILDSRSGFHLTVLGAKHISNQACLAPFPNRGTMLSFVMYGTDEEWCLHHRPHAELRPPFRIAQG